MVLIARSHARLLSVCHEVTLQVVEELLREWITRGCLIDNVLDHCEIIKGMGRLTCQHFLMWAWPTWRLAINSLTEIPLISR